MRRMIGLLLILTCGCSTAPLADLLDAVAPARVENVGPARGGVAPLPVELGSPEVPVEPFWPPAINDRTAPPPLQPVPGFEGTPTSR